MINNKQHYSVKNNPYIKQIPGLFETCIKYNNIEGLQNNQAEQFSQSGSTVN